MSNLSEIKRHLGVETINLNKVVTPEGVETDWLKDWNNDSRIAILIHKDTLAAIKANPAISQLGVKETEKQGDKGPYTAKVICMYKPAEVTL